MPASYPLELPGPATYSMAPSQQLAITASEGNGPIDYRRRTRYPGATATVSFRYLEDEYKIFLAWWVSDLLYGHRWFTLSIPSAGGITPHVVRFTSKFKASKQGYRHMEVTADLEIFARKFGPPTYEVFTSQPYPTILEDSLDASASFVSAALLSWPVDSVAISHAFIGGGTTVVQTYYPNWPPESVSVTHAFLGGGTAVVQRYYSDWPVESVALTHTFLGGGTTIVQITYSFWPSEAVDSSGTFVSGVLA